MKISNQVVVIILVWLIFFLTLCCVTCTKEDNILPDNRLLEVTDSLRTDLEGQLNETVPSLSVLIQTSRNTYFACSFASGETKITPDTWFRFASNTKNFTAASILNMYEDGWLDYRSKITEKIPGSHIPYVPASSDWNIPNKEIITIEQLLQHAAGVYDVDNDTVPGLGGLSYTSFMLDQDPGHPFSSTELIKQVTNHDLKYFYSGEGQQYSNTGYTILGEIIARVYSFRAGSDKTYSDYLYDYVYGPSATVPLQVHFPYLATDQSLPEPFCCGTIIDPGPGEFGTNCQNNMSAHVAEGTGYGTMKELNKYIRTLMKGENLLQPSTVEIMKNSTTTFNSGYALGTLYIKNMGYGHNGAIRGYLSLMLYDPASDVSVVTMMPFWDLSQGEESFLLCFNVVHHLASEARKVLGFTGMS